MRKTKGIWIVAVTVLAMPAHAAPLSLSPSSAALSARSECVPFEWKGDGRSTKGAIVLPVTLDGKHMQWQLDTGADVNMSYGSVADQAGLSQAKDSQFDVRTLLIGTTSITNSFTFIRREMGDDDGVTGTLGLNSLMGRIAVIDYPAKRFCLFEETKLPQLFWSATYINAVLRDRKLFVPVEIGPFKSNAILFDTGSSEVSLSVDMPLWHQITGKASTSQSDKRIDGQAWGKNITLFGAVSSDYMRLGTINLGKQIVFTEKTSDTFASYDYRIDGIMGNAAVWDGIVILDLSVRTRIGVIRP